MCHIKILSKLVFIGVPQFNLLFKKHAKSGRYTGIYRYFDSDIPVFCICDTESLYCFDFFAITADGKLSIQLPTSYFVPKPQL